MSEHLIPTLTLVVLLVLVLLMACALCRGLTVRDGLRAELAAACRELADLKKPGVSEAFNVTARQLRCLVRTPAVAEWHEVNDLNAASLKAGMEKRPDVFEGCAIVEIEG